MAEREIKFKAWALIPCHTLVFNEPVGTGGRWESKHEMCDVLAIYLSKNKARVRYTRQLAGKKTESNTVDLPYPNNLKMLQYTEHKDQNGQEIYDGHILGRESFAAWVVTYKEGAPHIYNLNNPSQLFPLNKHDLEYREIIGHIYSTPELLTA